MIAKSPIDKSRRGHHNDRVMYSIVSMDMENSSINRVCVPFCFFQLGLGEEEEEGEEDSSQTNVRPHLF
jgi:hypothetical protein